MTDLRIGEWVGSQYIKPLLRPVISGGFHAWHRVKALDKWSPDKSIFTQQPRSYCARGEVVVKTVHGVNVIVDGDDTDMTPRVVFGDDVEMRDEVAAKEILRGGDWIIDVGSRLRHFVCWLRNAWRDLDEFSYTSLTKRFRI